MTQKHHNDEDSIPKSPVVAAVPSTTTTPPITFTPDPEICLENFDILAKKYKPLMHRHISIVYRMHSKLVEVADLEQEALIGLLKAIEHFDPKKGVYFPVYLSKAIQNKLLSYCRNTTPHYYKKDAERGEGKFKRIRVHVETLDDPNTNSRY